MNFLQPWVLVRLAIGAVTTWLFLRAAWIAARTLRYDHLARATAGQLALERQAELSATTVRVGAGLQLLLLVLTVAAADGLSGSIQGAMCGYGVVHANDAGPWAVGATVATTLAAGVFLHVLRFDRRLRQRALTRGVAVGTLVLAIFSLVDFTATAQWLGGLDLSIVTSCCSTGDDATREVPYLHASSTRLRSAVTWVACVGVPLVAAAAWASARRGGRKVMAWAGWWGLAMLPVAWAAVTLVVAPHVYEVPQHTCAYCLVRADAWWVGYPLFGSLLLAGTRGVGASVGVAATPRASFEAVRALAQQLLTRSAWAWLLAWTLGVALVLRYRWLSGGAALFLGKIVLIVSRAPPPSVI